MGRGDVEEVVKGGVGDLLCIFLGCGGLCWVAGVVVICGEIDTSPPSLPSSFFVRLLLLSPSSFILLPLLSFLFHELLSYQNKYQ